MLRQPAFVAAEFHTGFLDELLQRRGGEGFSDVDPSLEEVAAIAACIADVDGRALPAGPKGPALRASERTVGPVLLDRPAASWKRQARLEGLRG